MSSRKGRKPPARTRPAARSPRKARARAAAPRRRAPAKVLPLVREISDVRRRISAWRRAGLRIAFVPTMGAVHAGHLSLVARARRGADRVVASIFVNPLQFGPREDYRRYPRPLARDRELLAAAGVNLLWHPEPEDLYPIGFRTRVQVPGLTSVLEGASRPGHLEGVCTVVTKLLNVVQPHVLWLGQKDAQQARVIEQMVADLDLPVLVSRGATVREADGLALSSRNAYLSPRERRQALALSTGLKEARRRLAGGERSGAKIAEAVRRVLKRSPLVKEDYVAVVDALTLEPVTKVRGRVLVALAARVGPARLIDNIEWEPR